MSEHQSIVVARGDVTLSVTVVGPKDAPVVTFGHSLSADTTMWWPQDNALRDKYRLVFIDFRGHGKSSVPAGPYRIEDLANDVIAVWDALGIETSFYAGVSLGGSVAIALALAVPERIRGILVSSCSLQASAPYVAIWQDRAKVLETGGMAAMAEHLMPRWLSEETIAKHPEAAARLRHVIETSSPAGWHATVAALCALSFQEHLPDVAVPVIFACGSADPVGAMMRAYPASVPGAVFEDVEDGYHILNMDKPEAFNQLIEHLVARGAKTAQA